MEQKEEDKRRQEEVREAKLRTEKEQKDKERQESQTLSILKPCISHLQPLFHRFREIPLVAKKQDNFKPFSLSGMGHPNIATGTTGSPMSDCNPGAATGEGAEDSGSAGTGEATENGGGEAPKGSTKKDRGRGRQGGSSCSILGVRAEFVKEIRHQKTSIIFNLPKGPIANRCMD